MKYFILAMAGCIALSIVLTYFVEHDGKTIATAYEEDFGFLRR